MMKKIKSIDPLALFLVVCLVTFDGAAWWTIVASAMPARAHIYFLGVAAGDSELVVLPGIIRIMIDAGPDQSVLESLSKVMPENDASIDLAIISTPEAGHFAGFATVLDHYRIGAFLYNGRNADAPDADAWRSLLEKIAAQHIPLITLGAGDSIHYGVNKITILSPDDDFSHSAAQNDAALVELIKTGTISALFASDAGANAERNIAAKYGVIHADVLQGGVFLDAVHPSITTTSTKGGTTDIWAEQQGTAPRTLRARTAR